MQLLVDRLDKKLRAMNSATRYVLWGTGELGEKFLHHIQHSYPNFSCLGFTSNTVTEQSSNCFYGIKGIPVNALFDLKPDLLIVASVRFEKDILLEVNRILTDKGESLDVFYPSKSVEELELWLSKGIDEIERSKLTSLIYAFPESPVLWRKLAALSRKEEREVIEKCAEMLSFEVEER